MLKDILSTITKEFQNEKNQEQMYGIAEPFLNKLKLLFYILFIISVVVIVNLVYTNILLSDINKNLSGFGGKGG